MKIKASSDGILKDILKEELSKKYTRYLKRQNALYYINGFESKNYYEVKKGDIIEIKFESKINKEEKIFILDDETISLLKQKIYDLQYYNYDEKYVNIKIKDGHQWNLKIKYSNTEKIVHGDNKYPTNYDDLINIINLLKEKNNIQ